VLTGLNYLKGKKDPVALPDEEYPDWLWKCLDVIKTANAEDGLDGGDEFCRLHGDHVFADDLL
jgi:large subunit ribosomal protein L54